MPLCKSNRQRPKCAKLVYNHISIVYPAVCFLPPGEEANEFLGSEDYIISDYRKLAQGKESV